MYYFLFFIFITFDMFHNYFIDLYYYYTIISIFYYFINYFSFRTKINKTEENDKAQGTTLLLCYELCKISVQFFVPADASMTNQWPMCLIMIKKLKLFKK